MPRDETLKEQAVTMAHEIERLFQCGHMILAAPMEASRAVLAAEPDPLADEG